MDWTTVLVATLLIAVSLMLLSWHWSTWQQADHGGLAERDRTYLRRQFRRRTNASGMIGLVGLMMLSTLWIQEAWLLALIWMAILAALLWVVLIAVLDGWVTHAHYGHDQAVTSAQIEALKQEIRKFQDEQRRGE